MHAIECPPIALDELNIRNWFEINIGSLASVAQVTPGAGHIRTGSEILPEGKFVIGVPPNNIKTELAKLTELVTKIHAFVNSTAGTVRAAAFFHLRFEAIHPLTDGNGRVGRLLLAKQCETLGLKSARDILTDLMDNEPFYKMVFLADIPSTARFELLIDIIARSLEVTVEEIDLPFPLEPDNVKRMGVQFRFVPE